MNKWVLRCTTLCAATIAMTQAGVPADVAYAKDGVLYLADSAGRQVRAIKTQISICDFAISPSAASVVFVPCDNSDYGGPLYLLDINSNAVQKLTVGPYWQVANDTPVHEVYSDPEYSPDGASIVFTVRKIPVKGHADLVEASGPLAIMRLRTREVHLLKSTLDFGGNGPAFANQPHWSPDGTKILVSFETGFAILPTTGTTIQMLEPEPLPGNADWSTAFSWAGSRCILFGAGHNGVVRSAEIVRLASLKPEPASSFSEVSLGSESKTYSIQVSANRLLVGSQTESTLFDAESHGLLSHFPAGAKLLKTSGYVPPGCN